MAKDSNAPVYVLAILGGILAILALLAFIAVPILYLSLPIYFIVKLVRTKPPFGEQFKKLQGKVADFWLNTDEQSQFEYFVKQQDEVQEKVTEIETSLLKTHRYGLAKGISVNKDGTFSRRSDAGKKLAGQMALLNSFLEENRRKLNSIRHAVRGLSETPRLRRNVYVNFKIAKTNAVMGIVVWAATGLYYSAIHPSGLLTGLKNFALLPITQFSRPAIEFGFELPDIPLLHEKVTPWYPSWLPSSWAPPVNDFFEVEVLGLCLLVNAVFFFAIPPISRWFAPKRVPKPPLVDLSNYRQWTGP